MQPTTCFNGRPIDDNCSFCRYRHSRRRPGYDLRIDGTDATLDRLTVPATTARTIVAQSPVEASIFSRSKAVLKRLSPVMPRRAATTQ
jgi:hypothetical protein